MIQKKSCYTSSSNAVIFRCSFKLRLCEAIRCWFHHFPPWIGWLWLHLLQVHGACNHLHQDLSHEDSPLFQTVDAIYEKKTQLKSHVPTSPNSTKLAIRLIRCIISCGNSKKLSAGVFSDSGVPGYHDIFNLWTVSWERSLKIAPLLFFLNCEGLSPFGIGKIVVTFMILCKRFFLKQKTP